MVEAKFSIGQLVTHSIYGYRGVIIDADPEFTLSDSWYEKMATTKPSKQQPWYHILVNNSSIQTYVSESSLDVDLSEQEIQHPMIDLVFCGKSHGQYKLAENLN
ncbi:DNA-binding protein [Idiomarina sp. X4]|uniref:Heat shock protein HspQ n=1 Tax=Idiomarina piscisalsi TaxID=1096243 RepID=A0ABM6LTN5_9GAMM|nr:MULTISPECIES: heat shock protein HspQ [Idiomarina]ASG65905.1 DNA-binding protein [Idiomarina piscisalsi]ATZ74465.1 DNA-binding protein [Idiomarina sp. X4]MTJ02999.1 heat shock protein HspQ [Idiomarina piscisalsi]RXS44330.1 heat shock protein HspQ [Idiomarina sp. 29L]